MYLKIVICVLIILSSAVINVLPARSWTSDATINTPITTATGGQYSPRITTDGSGGAIITWRDNGIFAQRVDANGSVLWIIDGVAISASGYTQSITADGSGGAIITWDDNGIYAQRVNGEGSLLWTIGGVAISTATGTSHSKPQITTDGSGGAIIAWRDKRSGSYDIYAQRVNGEGSVLWTANGVEISTSIAEQYPPQIISDGSGGAVITWEHDSTGIFAQRINGAGSVLWTTNGVAISDAANDQDPPRITTDGSGGAIITWQDYRNSNWDIYAQRVNGAGTIQWTNNGVAVSTAASFQTEPQITTDDSGGAIITWQDYRNGNYDIYTQRVNGAGTVQWTSNGVAVSTAAAKPQITTDDSGGAIITWQDSRNGNSDIYAQHVNIDGSFLWTTVGVAVSTAANNQNEPQITTDGSDGVIITWQDSRNGDYYEMDIYAQRVFLNGALNAVIVTPSAGIKGSISPDTQQAVNHGDTVLFTVTPDLGYEASVGGTCGGELIDNIYTTIPVNADCTVKVTFEATSKYFIIPISKGNKAVIISL